MQNAARVESGVKIQRKRGKPKFLVIEGSRELGREEGHALLVSISERIRSKNGDALLSRRAARLERFSPERRSVQRAMLAVEEKLVKALWIIERSTSSGRPRGYEGRNGIDYGYDVEDTHARYVDAPGGKYEAPPPRPALPESKEISEARKVQRWLELLNDDRAARLFTTAAGFKRGDAGRKVNWTRVRARLPELADYSTRHLQGIYTAALRTIVAELTLERIN